MSSTNVEQTNASTAENVPEAILKQVEFYFSAQNLMSDNFLVKQMNDNFYVPIEVLASFSKIKNLTSDVATIANALKLSKAVELDSTGTMVRPCLAKPTRNTLLLRNIPGNTPEADIRALFADNTILSIKFDVLDTCLVTLGSEEAALEAFNKLSTSTFGGRPVQVGLKTSNALKTMLEQYRSILKTPASGGFQQPFGQDPRQSGGDKRSKRRDGNNHQRQSHSPQHNQHPNTANGQPGEVVIDQAGLSLSQQIQYSFQYAPTGYAGGQKGARQRPSKRGPRPASGAVENNTNNVNANTANANVNVNAIANTTNATTPVINQPQEGEAFVNKRSKGPKGQGKSSNAQLGPNDFPPLPQTNKKARKQVAGITYSNQQLVSMLSEISAEKVVRPEFLNRASEYDAAVVLASPNTQLELTKPLDSEHQSTDFLSAELKSTSNNNATSTPATSSSSMKSFVEAAITARDIKPPERRSSNAQRRSSKTPSDLNDSPAENATSNNNSAEAKPNKEKRQNKEKKQRENKEKTPRNNQGGSWTEKKSRRPHGKQGQESTSGEQANVDNTASTTPTNTSAATTTAATATQQ